MNFKGIRKMTLEQGKKILQTALDPSLDYKSKMFTIMEIYSGWERRELEACGTNHLRAIHSEIERLIMPSNIKPQRNTYINANGNLYELDLNPLRIEGKEKFISLLQDDWISNIEKTLSYFCIRVRREGYNMPWEKVQQHDRDAIAVNLLKANWREIIECFLYLKDINVIQVDGLLINVANSSDAALN